MELRRSLVLHSPLHRSPHAVLRAMLDRLPDAMPPSGEDGPVAVLERRMADLLGKPAALFFPSGTMAQQVALRLHAERTGRHAFAAHPMTHLDQWEQRGYAVVHGLRFQPVGARHELMSTEALAQVAEPVAAVLWELPQRDIGGRLPEWDTLCEQVALARDRGAATHLDGARLPEAQTYYERPFEQIAALFDTVYVSLYKSLGGVRGAVLAGDHTTVEQAAVWRQRLGGGIADAWPLALAGLVGLDTVLPRMAAYRVHAVAIADALRGMTSARTMPDPPQTPIFHVLLPAPAAAVERAAQAVLAETGVQVLARVLADVHPGVCRFEVTVGEPAMGFTPQEVAALVGDLLARATQ
jgi:threonine aldolase